jgi:hypothetical protein
MCELRRRNDVQSSGETPANTALAGVSRILTSRCPSPPSFTCRSRMIRRILLTIGLFGLAAATAAQTPYRIAPTPAWVEVPALPATPTIPDDQISDGLYYLRIDEQHRVESRNTDFFEYTAYAVANTQGIQNGSQIAIDFDPTYQSLTLHFVRIRRGDQVEDRLTPSIVNILQRETQLEYQIFDGTLTASIILEDIKAGDLIEYAFTTQGDNPIFDGIYSRGFNTQFDVPVHEITYRVIWPAGRTLHVRSYGAEAEPEITRSNGRVEYRWRFSDVPALIPDDQLPYWYDPYPWVQLSEWESWEHVATWGRGLFERVDQPSGIVRQEADRIRDRFASPRERLAAALRFTQDDIRYMGIEIGVNSHEPRSPAEVLQKRFGDCKDKSLLLVALLRELGIGAHPVLVNTIDAREMEGWLPAATLFDHAIVRATLQDTVYWYDPTSTLQRGSAEAIHQPDYDQVLVLEPNAAALTPMRPPVPNEPMASIEETFDLTAGLDAPAAYTVHSIYRSESADYMRNRFANESRQELAKSYLNYYADLYPYIRAKGTIEVEDDEAANMLRVTERYVIDSLWTPGERAGRPTAYFYPLEFGALLETPSNRIRTMPFGLSHPVHQEQHTRILLPEPWSAEANSLVVEDSAFDYRGSVFYEDQVITIRHRYRSKRDAVAPEDIAQYIRNVERVDEQLGYELTQYTGWLDSGTPWPISVMGVVFLIGLLVYFFRKGRSNLPSSRRTAP